MDLNRGFRVREWLVEPQRNQLVGPDGAVHLAPRTMEVLVCLAERAGQVISRDEFGEAVWSPAIVTDDALTRCIYDLRRQLDDDPSMPRFIETIPKRGYRLVAPVTPTDSGDGDHTDGDTKRYGARRWLLAALVAVALVGVLLYPRQAPPPERPLPGPMDSSVAVLPLETIGLDPIIPLAEGVHHDLITRLSEQGGLRVISGTSVRRYRDTILPIQDIAGELDVAWIVEGSVQQAGEEIQINVLLTEAATGTHRWARSYRERFTVGNLFSLKGEIIEDIVESVHARLDPGQRRAVGRVPTDNLEAYTRYVQGRTSLEARTQPAMRRAAEFFRSATAADPNYALAWVGLADSLSLLHDYGYAAPDDVLEEARAAIDRALDLDPELAEAHASLGLFHGTQRRATEAAAALRRAVELRPGYAEAHNWLGWLYSIVGDAEQTLESGRLAASLDPKSPESVSKLALGYIATGQFEQALSPARRGRALQPDFTTLPLYEAWALHHLGRHEEAVLLLDGLVAQWAGAAPQASLALALIASDRRDEARDVLERIAAMDDPFAEGLVHAGLGDAERAFSIWGEVEDWGYGAALVVHHLFPEVLGPLREDPRFRVMREEILAAFGWHDIEPAG